MQTVSVKLVMGRCAASFYLLVTYLPLSLRQDSGAAIWTVMSAKLDNLQADGIAGRGEVEGKIYSL